VNSYNSTLHIPAQISVIFSTGTECAARLAGIDVRGTSGLLAAVKYHHHQFAKLTI